MTGWHKRTADEVYPIEEITARLHAAYRLGIIDESFAKALHIFRRIRNDFAHSYHDMSFSDGRHRDRLHELVRPLIGGEYYTSVRSITQKRKLPEERTNFIIASSFLIGNLERVPDNVVTISDSTALSFSLKTSIYPGRCT